MYAHYQPGSYNLTADDIDGICAIYALPGRRPTELDSGTTIVPVSIQEVPPCDPTPRTASARRAGPLVAAATTSGVHDCDPGGSRRG